MEKKDYKIRLCPCGNIADRITKGRSKKCPKCGEKTQVLWASELYCRYCGKLFSQTDFEKPPDLNLEKKTFYCGCKGWN